MCRGSSDALGKVFLSQVRNVTAAGSSFTAAVSRLASSSDNQPIAEHLELKPAYQKLQQAVQQLEAAQCSIAKQAEPPILEVVLGLLMILCFVVLAAGLLWLLLRKLWGCVGF
jgi:hypothetical protein